MADFNDLAILRGGKAAIRSEHEPLGGANGSGKRKNRLRTEVAAHTFRRHPVQTDCQTTRKVVQDGFEL